MADSDSSDSDLSQEENARARAKKLASKFNVACGRCDLSLEYSRRRYTESVLEKEREQHGHAMDLVWELNAELRNLEDRRAKLEESVKEIEELRPFKERTEKLATENAALKKEKAALERRSREEKQVNDIEKQKLHDRVKQLEIELQKQNVDRREPSPLQDPSSRRVEHRVSVDIDNRSSQARVSEEGSRLHDLTSVRTEDAPRTTISTERTSIDTFSDPNDSNYEPEEGFARKAAAQSRIKTETPTVITRQQHRQTTTKDDLLPVPSLPSRPPIAKKPTFRSLFTEDPLKANNERVRAVCETIKNADIFSIRPFFVNPPPPQKRNNIKRKLMSRSVSGSGVLGQGEEMEEESGRHGKGRTIKKHWQPSVK